MSWQHSVWPKDRHEEILGLIRKAYDGDLPDWAIEADLVYHADAANHPRRPKPFPGRRALEERYGLTEHKVKKHLRDPGWQEKCDQLGIPRPDRHLKGHGPTQIHPVDLQSTTPSTSPSETNEPKQSTKNRPVDLPPVTPSAATRAEIPPTLLSSSEEEQHVGDERRPAGEGKTEKAPKAKRAKKSNLPPRDLVKPLTDCWSAAWGDSRGRYPWEIPGADDHRMARCAVALGYPDGPAPPEALEQLQRAMAIYIAAAEAGEAWPPGPPTTDGFTRKVTEWLLKAGGAARASPADIPRASIEARVRQRLKAVSIPEARAEIRASNRLKPNEITYALSVLDRLEASR